MCSLTKRLPNPLRQTALYLPDRQHRIDQVAVVVNGDIAQQFDGTGLRIDLDLRRLTAVRKGKRYVLVEDKSVEAAIPASAATSAKLTDCPVDGTLKAPSANARSVASAWSSRAATDFAFSSTSSMARTIAPPPICMERAPP